MSISTLARKPGTPENRNPIAEDLQGEILWVISRVEYGSVEIVIHDGQVVQIETREKKRFGTGPKAGRQAGAQN
ncbi:MAG: YezD family protein [Burkholderiales bacterium]|nr:YezD family protein [Burkholderiales bacterium]